MNKIPKIIHQIWSDKYRPLPKHLKRLGETWQEHYPTWEYKYWEEQDMNNFIREHFPQYGDIYNRFPYDAQRWDAVRYLILYKMGGMYVDFDYESIYPIDELIRDKSCCFPLESEAQSQFYKEKVKHVFNNALVISTPQHPFILKVIKTIFNETVLHNTEPKFLCVLKTTGPWALMDLYYSLTDEEKKDICLIPAKYVAPFSADQSKRFIGGETSDELENCLEEAYAVHYYLGDWI
jgi:Mannosyltransferase OCH1 and related enzymes